MVQIRPYTEFLNQTYQCIVGTFDSTENSLRVFCEGSDQPMYSGTQEYAVLRNEYARFFFDAVCNHAEILGIQREDFILKSSLIYPDEVKLVHSCYPKNIRRWLNGTISRKKKCRVEFCILVWCHATGWNSNVITDTKLKKCQDRMKDICSRYIEVDEGIPFSVELLWKAASSAYEQSY